MRRIAIAAAIVGGLLIVALVLVRPSLALAAIAAALTGLLLGAALGVARAGPALRARRREAEPEGPWAPSPETPQHVGPDDPWAPDAAAAPASAPYPLESADRTIQRPVPTPAAAAPSGRRARRRPVLQAVAVAAIAVAGVAAAIVVSGGDDRAAAPPTPDPSPTRTPPTDGKPKPLPPKREPVTVVATARYTAGAELDDRRWRLDEHFVLTPDVLPRGISRRRAMDRLVEQAPQRGWRASRTVDGVRLDRTRHPGARVESFPHFLTANRIALGKVRWTAAPGVLVTVSADRGSALTLRAPRRMVRNTNPAGTALDVAGDVAVTRLVLAEGASPYGATNVEFDLANGLGRSRMYSALRAASLWSGIVWLLGAVITAAVAAGASVLVPRYLARRLPSPEPARAPV